MMKKFPLAKIVLAIVLFTLSQSTFSQCKKVGKKCLPSLSPYIYTGQLNSTTLNEGETAELQITLYSGQSYRILVCSPEFLGKVVFNVFDSKKKLLYASKDHSNAANWDFRVNSTDDYTIQVTVPHSKNIKVADIAMSGCIAVLVGFKNE